MSEKIKYSKPEGFFDTFDRRPGTVKKNMHYCPGCGHGVLHKLIAEALSDLKMQDNTVIIAPVGCAVFTYYYFDCCGISVPHGRAPAVATGIERAHQDSMVISYQGDGDLGAIGFNNFIQAANRGENIIVCFVNNAVYGMTGGQMAPTTLPGQKTMTSPYGRSTTNEGYPMKVSEMVAALDSPIYVERVALTTPSRIRNARKALRKGLKYMIDHKGFSLVEFLSPCPVNWKMNSSEANEWIEKKMLPHFPLKCFKDIGEKRKEINRVSGIYDPEKVKEVLYPKIKGIDSGDTTLRKQLRIKIAGFGGQGILSLGIMISLMGQLRNINVTWLPSYGPEMRGGTANCSVVLNNDEVGSPMVDQTNILIAMNQPSIDKFLPSLNEKGILLYDSTNIKAPETNARIYSVDAGNIAEEIGNLKCANSVIMGAFSTALEGLEQSTYEKTFKEALKLRFKWKESIIEDNIKAFRLGKKLVKRENLKNSK